MHFLLRTKGSHETNFDIFKCSDENVLTSSCHFPTHRSVFLQILHDSSVSWNILLCTFLGQTLYTLHKRDQSQCKCFRLFGAQIKIHQILVIFDTKNKCLFKFCTTLIVRIGVSTPTPLNSTTPSFLPRSPLNWQTVQAPFLGNPPLYIVFLWMPPLKVGSFNEPPKY